jgi:hypothetical protein
LRRVDNFTLPSENLCPPILRIFSTIQVVDFPTSLNLQTSKYIGIRDARKGKRYFVSRWYIWLPKAVQRVLIPRSRKRSVLVQLVNFKASVLNVRLGNQLAEPTTGQVFDRVQQVAVQRNDPRGPHIPSSVRLSIGSQWQNQIFTIKGSLPASHIFLIIVSLSSPFCSQFSTCFFRKSYLHCSKFSIRLFNSST